MIRIKIFCLSFLVLFLFDLTNAANNTLLKESFPKSDSIHKTYVALEIKDLKRIESLLKPEKQGILSEYGTVFIAIVALFGSVLTASMTSRRSRLNMQQQLQSSTNTLREQLTASERNLTIQLVANRTLEIEKKTIETKQKIIMELKDNVAKFINLAIILNQNLDYIIDIVLEKQGEDAAMVVYSSTLPTRDQLKDIYYSIKVSLDGSPKQMELEREINRYMNVVHFYFKIDVIESEQYQQSIGKLYHKIKAIIHDNYVEPL